MKDNCNETIEYIVSMLKEAGYEPYDQLYAYISTGNESYITCKCDARTMVTNLDRSQLKQYIYQLCK